MLAALLAGKINLALLEGPEQRTALHIEPFTRDHMVLVVPLSHEWAGRRITRAQLQTQPLLTREFGSGSRRIVEEALAHTALSSPLQYSGFNLTCPASFNPLTRQLETKITVTPTGALSEIDEKQPLIRAASFSATGQLLNQWLCKTFQGSEGPDRLPSFGLARFRHEGFRGSMPFRSFAPQKGLIRPIVELMELVR